MGIYGIWVVGDYLIQNHWPIWLDWYQSRYYAEAGNLEKDRAAKQDKQMIADARAQGYRRLIPLFAFDDKGKFQALAEKYQIAPLAPRPNSQLYYANEGYGLVKYHSDRFGFRNRDDLWNDKNADIVLIGDSFTFGACVEEKNSIAGYLTAADTPNKVLNLATPGNGPIHYASIAKTFLPIISAKYLVVIFYANDNDNEEGSIFKRLYFQNSPHYFDHTKVNDVVLSINLVNLYAECEILREEHEKQSTNLLSNDEPAKKLPTKGFVERGNLLSRGAKYLTLPNIRMSLSNYLENLNKPLPYSSKLAIDTVISECKKFNCQPIFVYIPNSEFWRPDARAKKYAQLLKNYIVTDKGGVFVDTTQEISQKGREAYAIAGPHLSPLGYQIVAQQIIEAIKK